MAATSNKCSWRAVPDEVKFAILQTDTLTAHDVRAFSAVDTLSYQLALPLLYNTVKISSKQALDSFLAAVHPAYFAFINNLDICTKHSDAAQHGDSDEVTAKLLTILQCTPRLTRLSLSVGGSMRSDILPVFSSLTRLQTLSISNWADEEIAPLSERLVLAIVLALPALRDLSLSRITRSALYAPELLGRPVPVVHNDADVPTPASAHDLELRLPSLLALSRLRRLRIRETHLGDPLWGGDDRTSSSRAPQLEVLDLGASPYETPAFNDHCTQRILSRAPTRSLHTFALSTGTSSPSDQSSCPPSPVSSSPPSFGAVDANADTPFPSLRTLHLTPLVPPPLLASTLAQPALAQSPVHTLSCAFDPADAAEGCRAVEGFLWARGINPLSAPASPSSSSTTRTKRARAGTLAVLPSSSSSSSALKRRSTLSLSSTGSDSARPYPALHTLAISLSPPAPPPTPASYSPKLAARIAARRAREAEERGRAARSLVKCCRTLGVHAEVCGIEIDVESEEDEEEEELMEEGVFGTAAVAVAPKVTLNGRSRSKTA